MTEQEQLVRQQEFDADGAIEIDVAIGAGRIEVHLVDEPGVRVRVRHAPETANKWTEGISSLVAWFSGGAGENPGVDVVRETRIEFSENKLVVRTPKGMQLLSVPVEVVVAAPVGSHVQARSGAADITVTGPAGRLELTTGSGDVRTDRADGAAQVNSGTGEVRLGAMPAGLRAKTGSGAIEVSAIGGTTTLFTGSGNVRIGAVAGDVMAKTGSGDVSVADATSGELNLITGTGAIRVGVHAGSKAEIDLVSATGEARSELPLSDQRPDRTPVLKVHGRTGSGSALVTAAG